MTVLGVSPVLKKARLWGTDLSGSMQSAGGVGGMLSESSLITSNPITFNSFYPTYDGNGNVSEYLAANGNIAVHFEYDPFGNTVVNTDTANQFAYRFSTKPRDTETGFYYYGYRYYDSMTGRWPSRDPIKELGDWVSKTLQSQINSITMLFLGGQVYKNSYIFIGNSSLSYVDLNGEFGWGLFGGAIGGSIGGVTSAIASGSSVGGVIAAGVIGGIVGGAVGLIDPFGGIGAAIVGGAVGGAIAGAITAPSGSRLRGAVVGAVVGGISGVSGPSIGIVGMHSASLGVVSAAAVELLNGAASYVINNIFDGLSDDDCKPGYNCPGDPNYCPQ